MKYKASIIIIFIVFFRITVYTANNEERQENIPDNQDTSIILKDLKSKSYEELLNIAEKSTNITERKYAIMLLKKGDKVTIDLLKEIMKTDNEEMRISAVIALRHTNTREAESILLKAFDDKSQKVRFAIVIRNIYNYVKEMAETDIMEYYGDSLKNSLGISLEVLLKAIKDSSDEIVNQAIKQITTQDRHESLKEEFNNNIVSNALLEVFKDKKRNKETRASVLIIYAKINSRFALPIISKALIAKDKEIRIAAINSLRYLEETSDEAESLLFSALSDENEEVRYSVVIAHGSWAYGLSYPSEDILFKALEDKSERIYCTALNGIRQYCNKERKDRLIKYLKTRKGAKLYKNFIENKGKLSKLVPEEDNEIGGIIILGTIDWLEEIMNE